MLGEYLKNSYDIQPSAYKTYYIKPDYTISNNGNVSIANAFAYAYKPLMGRLNLSLKTTTIEFTKQFYFTIVIKRGHAGFYISIPEGYEPLILGKMSTVWNKAEIRAEEVKPIIPMGCNIQAGELLLKDYSFKSLHCSTNDLYPLTNMLGITKQLKDDEEVRITTAIQPYSRLNWMERQKYQLNDYKEGKIKNLERSKGEKIIETGIKVTDQAMDLVIEVNTFVLESLLGFFISDEPKDKKSKEVTVTINDRSKDNAHIDNLSEYTRYKLNSDTFLGRIIITATGANTERNKLNVMSVANSYRDLQGDNAFILKMFNAKETETIAVDINKKLIKIGKQNIFSDKEVAKFIQLPQKDLQNEYGLEHIDTREVPIPETLQGGPVRIGIAEQQGKDITCTFSKDINVIALPRVIVGPQGVGKTTTLKRIVKDSYKAEQANIVIDVIEDCDTAKEISEVVEDKDKIIIIVGTKDYIQPMSYTEVSKLITEETPVYERVRLADLIAEQVEYLVDAVSGDRIGDLTVPMMRYLHSACLVTFIKPMTTLADVFKVLRDYRYRAEMVTYAKHSKCFRLDDEVFLDLEELDKKEKSKVVGTRDDLIIGILNRIAMLQKNRTIKEMLSAPIDVDQDFTNYINQGKQVFIMIPQNKIPSQQIRDVISTYFVTRLWLTVQLRESNKQARLCSLIFDEVRIVPTTTKFISNHITEFRRHRLGTIFTCHYLKQFGTLLEALKSAGASYMLLAGTEKENIEALKYEISPFTVEETLKLKEHTSLNIIKANSSEYSKFITRQPKY